MPKKKKDQVLDAKNMEKPKDLKFREETFQNIKRSLGRHLWSTQKQARMATEHARKQRQESQVFQDKDAII